MCDCYIVNSKFGEELEQNIDVLLLNQEVRRSHCYTGNNQSPGEDRRGEQACPRSGSDDGHYDF